MKVGIAVCNACLKPTPVLYTDHVGIHSKCCNASIVHKNIDKRGLKKLCQS